MYRLRWGKRGWSTFPNFSDCRAREIRFGGNWKSAFSCNGWCIQPEESKSQKKGKGVNGIAVMKCCYMIAKKLNIALISVNEFIMFISSKWWAIVWCSSLLGWNIERSFRLRMCLVAVCFGCRFISTSHTKDPPRFLIIRDIRALHASSFIMNLILGAQSLFLYILYIFAVYEWVRLK